MGAVTVALTASCNCSPRGSSRAESAANDLAPPGPLRVEVDGCATMRSGAGCVRPSLGVPTKCERTRHEGAVTVETPMRLVVWADRRASLEVDGRSVPTEPVEVDGGQQWKLEVSSDAKMIALRCGPGQPPCWSLPLVPAAAEPPAMVDARMGLRRGKEQARQQLQRLEAALPGQSLPTRTAALDVITDLRLALAPAEPDLERRTVAYREALARTVDAFEAARAQGELDRASCHARRGMVYALDSLGDLGQAQQWRERLASLADVPAGAMAINRYYEGLLAQREGDLKTARAAYLAAERGARRLDDWPMQRASLAQAATVLASLGLDAEVEALFERLQGQGQRLTCLQWIRVFNNLAWSRYVLRELGRPAPDPLPALDELLLWVALDDGDDACHDPGVEENVRLNLGLVAADRGWWGEAAQLLESLPPGGDSGVVGTRFWRALLRQRLVLGRGDRGELVELLMREPAPRPGAPPEQVWLAQQGRGEAFEALGLSADAVQAYRAAEAALDTLMRNLDFDSARDRLLRGRQSSAGRLVALMAERGDASGALCAARRARRRTHDALDRPSRIAALTEAERERWRAAIFDAQRRRADLDRLHERTWSLAGDELASHEAVVQQQQRQLQQVLATAHGILYGSGTAEQHQPSARCEGWSAPPSDELGLLYFPIDRQELRWQGFAFDDQGVAATAVIEAPSKDASPSAWSDALLRPFSESLRRAEGVRVLPTGALWAVAFSALPWDGDVLLAHAPVSISLDLAGRSGPRDPAGRSALVVADPRGDLLAARREADVVVEALTAHGWTTQSLVGREAMSGEVQARLPTVDLLHYAGHGRHEGAEGWGSALRLAGEQSLQVRDVLALPRVPSVVMLPACDTASTAPATLGGGMSIARAFVLAGADVVVASRDLLDDEFAGALAEELYANGPVTRDEGPADLRRAVLAARRRFGPETWSPVVVLVP
ncbi:MAG: CHAT domain-containing protein [Deltaproteobacteria bacterium]|nr:CHAT domain-containing protein [Deltaproteobacteria bacterium]